MSNKSIDSRIQGLEERLRIEHGHPRPRNRPGGTSQARRQLELSSIPTAAVSRATLETEVRLREIYQMSGNLTINGVNYRSDISDLKHLGELGNGTCGHVVKMLHVPSNAVIAVKQMRRSGNSEENRRILMDLEVVLRSHDCPYIVRCLGYFITEADVWICMELMASCFDKILKRLGGPIPEEILGKVTVATVNALSYLKEEHGVIHRDVKPSNILIDERGIVKLCDFGISGRLVDSKAKTRSAGCAAYMAPERIDPPDPQKPDYDIRADVWSLGITLFELATGNFPYSNCSNDFEVLAMVIAAEPPTLPDTQVFSEDFKSFVRQCLTKDYRHRPKYAALLEHPFVDQATSSGTSVASWLITALPSCSSRLVAASSISCELNNVENENSDHQTLPSTPQSSGSNNSVQSVETDKSVITCATSSNGLSTTSAPCETININSLVNKTVTCTVNSPDSDVGMNSSSISNRLKGTEDYENTVIRKSSIESETNKSNNLTSNYNCNESITDSFKATDNNKSLNDSNISSGSSTPVSSNDSVINNSVQNPTNNIHKPPKESQSNSSLTYRTRSLSNASTHDSNLKTDKWSTPKFFTGSPSPKNYFNNVEPKNQPLSSGGPSSFDNYVSYGKCQDVQSGFRSYGSPEVSRRQYYSPSRNKFVYNYEYGTPRLESHTNNVTPNYSQRKEENLKNVCENGAPPACFRPNGPTNYFVSTSVCTMSKYPGSPSIRYCSELSNTGNFHQNIGGSCSQPASLEAYGDMRHNPSGQPRMNEKSFSPPLWSPQFGCRWGGRDREEKERELRNMSDSNHQQGNTSPIVLQRFFHQQGQRRSRRDWDASSRQPSSSLSRETSLGRSPEPPRRAHRDPSLPRDHLPLQYLDHHLRERELTPSRSILRDKNELMSNSLDLEKQSDCLQGRFHMYETNVIESGYSQSCKRDNGHICNDKGPQFESKPFKSTFHHHMREKEIKPEPNGDCQRAERVEKVNNDSGNFSNMHDQLLLERKNSKERSNVLRDRDKKDNVRNGDNKEEISQLSPMMLRRLGKSNGKDKDEQGGSRSSSPNRNLLTGGSAKVSRFTSHPQRITASDYDDVSKCSQDSSRNFTSDTRIGGRAPKVPPRKTTASWSLPASPLPTRPV